jgi:hypothetical protein
MVSPLTQCQITFPVHLDRPVAREQLWWLNSACKLLETRLLQVCIVCVGGGGHVVVSEPNPGCLNLGTVVGLLIGSCRWRVWQLVYNQCCNIHSINSAVP